MKIHYTDIVNSLCENPSIELLSKKLFQLGHEHEIEGDIFNMELTPNRGDCLSVNGLSRDLSVFFGKGPDKEIYTNQISDLEIDFENHSPIDCPNISFLEIEISNNFKKYKPYLNNYFKNLGLNKTNFFTDISNYLSYELGQPTHCYDGKKIDGKLEFKNKNCSESFITVLDQEVKLKDKNCVFTLNDEVINIAGVMGGKSTSCSKETTKCLVECAFFNPESIIGKSVKYNLNSDAAHKFERGVDILSQEKTLRRFIKIVEDHVDILSVKFKNFIANPYKPRNLEIQEAKINQILGTSISKEQYLSYLSSLGFICSNSIQIPSFRNDISSQNDLAEEIARLIGYNNIEYKPLNLAPKQVFLKSNEASISSYLVDNGFNEVINFPFCEENTSSSISISNPLDTNRGYMRTSIKGSLIKNLLYNERRQRDSIKLFEISDIYFKENDNISRDRKIGIIASGRQGYNYIDFRRKIDEKFMLDILKPIIKDKNLIIEEISRDDVKSKIKEKIYYLELSISDIIANLLPQKAYENDDIRFIKYKEISNLPSSSRDLSFSIKDPEALSILIERVMSYKSSILKKSFCFDYFINPKTDIIKIGFRFIFQSNTHSLSDAEIDSELNLLIDNTLKINGVSIPGLLD